jgi:hypothetical protein
MKIPSDLVARDEFYDEVIRHCTSSMDARRTQYDRLRHLYVHGREPDGPSSPFNKIYAHIDTLVSYLYAAESTRFAVDVPVDAPTTERGRLNPLTRALNEVWHKSGTDYLVSQAITWALVYNSMFIKAVHHVDTETETVEVIPYLVDPGSIGVYREDIMFMDRQEAIVHVYRITMSKLENDLASHPHRESIIRSIEAELTTDDHETSGLERLILTSVSPNYSGAIREGNEEMTYEADVSVPMVELCELWIWDDAEDDYRIVTRSREKATVWERKNFYLKQEHPFVQFCPSPMYRYVWGMSEVDGLAGLQTWRNERVEEVRRLLKQQVNPPTSFTGWEGVIDEKADFLMSEEGSYAYDSSGSAKVTKHYPQLPSDLFTVIAEIDSSFSERSGLQNILMGKGEPGVRSSKQAESLANLSSSRIKKRALAVEHSLNKLATLNMKLLRKYDATEYKDEGGVPFVAAQFTNDFSVSVDAHSSSPLFADRTRADAEELLKLGVISKARFVEMVNPPEKSAILTELPKLEKAQHDAAMAADAQKQHKKG